MIVGIDIGGTKCAVAVWSPGGKLLETARFPTQAPATTLERIEHEVARLHLPHGAIIGVACGGPLDTRRGLILSPPNLPGWHEVPVVARLEKSLRTRVFRPFRLPVSRRCTPRSPTISQPNWSSPSAWVLAGIMRLK